MDAMPLMQVDTHWEGVYRAACRTTAWQGKLGIPNKLGLLMVLSSRQTGDPAIGARVHRCVSSCGHVMM